MSEHAERIRALVTAGRADAAIDEADRQLTSTPDDPDVLSWAAIARSEHGDLAGAVELACRAVARVPDDAGYHRLLSNLLVRSGRVGQAVTEARIATELAPDDPSAWIGLAEAASTTRGSLGRNAARRAVELAPYDPAAWNALGINSRWRTRRRALERALELEPSMEAARLNLASTQQRLRPGARTDVAIDLARESPADREAHLRVVAAAAARRQAFWMLAVGGLFAVWSVFEPGSGIIWAVILLVGGTARLVSSRRHRDTLRAAAEVALDDLRARRSTSRAERGARPDEDPVIRARLRRRAWRFLGLAAIGVPGWAFLLSRPEAVTEGEVAAVFFVILAVALHTIVVAWCLYIEITLRVLLHTRPWSPWPGITGTVQVGSKRVSAVRVDGPEGRTHLVRVGVAATTASELSGVGRVRLALGTRFAVAEMDRAPHLALLRGPHSVASLANWEMSFRPGRAAGGGAFS